MGQSEWENSAGEMRRFGCVPFGTTCWYDLWDDLWQRPMPSPDAAARHTGAGVARRQAHHERMRDERAREAAAGDAELPPEDDAVEMASAVHVLDSVAEVGPNYTLLRSEETKAKRRKRKREVVRILVTVLCPRAAALFVRAPLTAPGRAQRHREGGGGMDLCAPGGMGGRRAAREHASLRRGPRAFSPK